MAILLRDTSRVIVQGATGRVGRVFAQRLKRHYRTFAGGVTPGRGGETGEGIPIFGSVRDAVSAAGANASVITVPGAGAADAAYEAIDAGLRTICIYTEGVPVHEAMRL